jgi:hypothetical protein
VQSEFESPSAIASAATSTSAPWDRRPGEPARWYSRFLLYLEQGPARTLAATYRQAGRSVNHPAKGANGWWATVALRDRRIAIADENVELARTLLANMQLLDLDLAGARALYP